MIGPRQSCWFAQRLITDVFAVTRTPDKGKGADWEGQLITLDMDDAKSREAEFASEMLAEGEVERLETFYRFSRDFLCKLFAVNCFELEDPGSVFDLIKVV